MELKDVILSTLAEMEDNEVPMKQVNNQAGSSVKSTKTEKKQIVQEECESVEVEVVSSNSELIFLNSLKERLLVLFEGFQAPNNSNIESKVDMTLNFLEYALATIDERAQQIDKGRLK